ISGLMRRKAEMLRRNARANLEVSRHNHDPESNNF
ncbi:MAG: epoxyqueuosine reductase, partial [Dolichospermum sp.]